MPSIDAAVILDVDGTLVDSNDAHARAWVQAFGENGITVAFDVVRRAIGMGGDKLMPAVAGIEEDSAIGQKIGERRGKVFRESFLPHLQPFPGVRALVQRFADEGFTLAVASSAKKEELDPLLEVAGVSRFISKRTSSDDAESSKPEPDIVLAALKKAGTAPGNAVMVGDTPYDVEAALRAGIQIVGFECGGWSRSELEGALEVYRDAADLLQRYDRSVFATVGRASSLK